MKPTLNLFFDFEFTSLSPDAQPISLGIVSDLIVTEKLQSMDFQNVKSFYCEFSDFEISRCDSWVKENVVSKLYLSGEEGYDKFNFDLSNYKVRSNAKEITFCIKEWLAQFSDYDIQFVCDCGSKDWEWLIQLIGEWEVKIFKQESKELHELIGSQAIYFGLPKLPSNISPVPFDLNDLIAIKKGISVREAFDLDRCEFLVKDNDVTELLLSTGTLFGKHNSLFDARIIKTIYNKLK